jgi:hypothetical protein
MADIRFKCNFTMLIAGASSSGKSTFVSHLLRNADSLYTETPGPVVYFYKVHQELFDELGKEGVVDQFIQGPPTMEWLADYCGQNENATIIIDDQAIDSSEDTSNIFSVGSHHLKCNVILITQSLFWKNKHARDISLSSTYIVLMKNPRDQLQITNFSKQFQPGASAVIRAIFKEATTRPYSYLIFDMHQKTPESLRMFSNIFNENNLPPVVYVRHEPKSIKN